MIIHYKDNPTSYKITFQKLLKYTDDFSFIPIKVSKTIGEDTQSANHPKSSNCVFQTPLMFSPYGIQHNGSKQTLDISFMNRPNDSHVQIFYENLQKIFTFVNNKFSKRYNVHSFLKDTSFDVCMRLKVGTNVLVFDQMRQKIDTIHSFSYGTFLLDLHGVWISHKPNREVWFQWYLVQAKIIEPICMQEYIFLDEQEPQHVTSKEKDDKDDKDDKYEKMLKMGVPKEAVERQKMIDSTTQSNTQPSKTRVSSNIPPPPPPPPQTSMSPFVKIQASDLQKVSLKPVSLTPEPKTNDTNSEMGYFEPPSLGDIQSMLKQLKPIN